jgi:hypothetical protein
LGGTQLLLLLLLVPRQLLRLLLAIQRLQAALLLDAASLQVVAAACATRRPEAAACASRRSMLPAAQLMADAGALCYCTQRVDVIIVNIFVSLRRHQARQKHAFDRLDGSGGALTRNELIGAEVSWLRASSGAKPSHYHMKGTVSNVIWHTAWSPAACISGYSTLHCMAEHFIGWWLGRVTEGYESGRTG